MDYYGGRFNGGNEKSLYQPGHIKPKHKSPKKFDFVYKYYYLYNESISKKYTTYSSKTNCL